MLRNIRQFFDQRLRTAGGPAGQLDAAAVRIATAALLVEVMRADRELKDAEQQVVLAAIRNQFGLDSAETASLVRLANAEADEATDYYQFTALINEHFTAGQKLQVVENLWKVAAADHEIDRFERTLVNKIADLLHVPRPAQVAARERALRSVRQSGDS